MRGRGGDSLKLSLYIFSLKLSTYILSILQAQDSRIAGKFVSFSLSVLKFVILGDGGVGGGGYLSGEDGRGGRGGAEAAVDRDGGGVLIGDGVGDGGGPSNERIFLVYKEDDTGQDSVFAFLFT